MQKCPNCGKENTENAKFCIDCGASLSDHNLRCPRCNSVTTSNSKICPKCGYRFTSVSSCETQSINTIDLDVLDDEEYEREQKVIKQRVFNSKIKKLNEDDYKNIKKEKIKEYNEDFASANSRISAEKMLKIEKIFHITSFSLSAFILLLASIFSFLPLVYTTDAVLYPYYFLFNIWQDVANSFYGWGFLGNWIAGSIAPICQFIFTAAFMITSLTLFLLVLIKGLNKMSRHDYKNNYYVSVLIVLLIALADMVAISLDQPVYMYSPTIMVFIIVSLVYLVAVGGYYVFKASVVKVNTLIIRRVLLIVSSLLGVGSLVLLSYRFVIDTRGSWPIEDYLNDLLQYLDAANNGLSFYLGFVGYFIYVLCCAFIGLSVLYSFRMIRKYNAYRLNNLIFNSFGCGLSILILIVFTLSTFYSNLNYAYEINIYPLLVVILEGFSLLITLVTFILLKDDRIKDNKRIELKNNDNSEENNVSNSY